MGMFDTIYFNRIYHCPDCNSTITDVQTKHFDCSLNCFHIGDCVNNNDKNSEIVVEKLYCDKCRKFIDTEIYLIIYRGILIDILNTIKEAESKLYGFYKIADVELVNYYHQLYDRFIKQQNEKWEYYRFLKDFKSWYEMEDEDKNASLNLIFNYNTDYFIDTYSPLEGVGNFLFMKDLEIILNEIYIRDEGKLEIYNLEINENGSENWSVDVLNDYICGRLQVNWIWTVMHKNSLCDGENPSEKWIIISEQPYSDKILAELIQHWIKINFKLDFKISIMPDNKIKDTNFYKRLNGRLKEMKDEECYTLKEVMEHLEQDHIKMSSEYIDKNKVKYDMFYYKGYHGSLAVDYKGKKLLGKIENYKPNTIIYTGNSIVELERNFKQEVNKILPKKIYSDSDPDGFMGTK